MHKAVCDECGKDCEVPFKPSGDKPIYCSSCFEKKEGGNSRRPTRRGSGAGGFAKGDNTHNKLLEQMRSLNTKLDEIINILETKTAKETVLKKTKTEKAAKKTTAKDKKTKTKKVIKKKAKKPALKD
jgi:CxxC-x17-CxxC domain-containing protein